MRTFPYIMFASLLGACGGGGGVADGVLDDLPGATLSSDPVVAKHWAGTSAPNAFGLGLEAYILADFATSNGEPVPTCPVKTTDGVEGNQTITYEGGCSTDDTTWRGKLVAKQTSSGDSAEVTVDYLDWGYDSTEDCNGQAIATSFTARGGMHYTGTETTNITFEVDVVYEGNEVDNDTCANDALKIGISYQGSAVAGGPDTDADGDPDQTTWSGSGRFGDTEYGTVSVKTEDELIDDVACEDEASSGSTTISSNGHSIGIRYDGATDCETGHTVGWTFDGADQGELTGVECNAGGSSGYAMLVVTLGLVLRRRRR